MAQTIASPQSMSLSDDSLPPTPVVTALLAGAIMQEVGVHLPSAPVYPEESYQAQNEKQGHNYSY